MCVYVCVCVCVCVCVYTHTYTHECTQAKGRDCIIPEVSRNHNIGAEGATVSKADYDRKLGLVAFANDLTALRSGGTDFGDLAYLQASPCPEP